MNCCECQKQANCTVLQCNHGLCDECYELSNEYLHICPVCNVPIHLVNRIEVTQESDLTNTDLCVLKDLEVKCMQSQSFSQHFTINEEEVISTNNEGSQRWREFPRRLIRTNDFDYSPYVDVSSYPSCEELFQGKGIDKSVDFGEYELRQDFSISSVDNMAHFEPFDMEKLRLSTLIKLKQDSNVYCIIDINQNDLYKYYTAAKLIIEANNITLELSNEEVVREFEIAEIVHPGNRLIERIFDLVDNKLIATEQLIFKSTASIDIYYRALQASLCLMNSLPANDSLFELLYRLMVLLYPLDSRKETYRALHLKPVTVANFVSGLTVIKGDNWEYGNEDMDNEEFVKLNENRFYLGRLAHCNSIAQLALVQWSNETLQNYRIGYQNKYDLVYYIENEEVIQNENLATPEAFKRCLRDISGHCICNANLKHELLFSDISIEKKLLLTQSLLLEGEVQEYFKEKYPDLQFKEAVEFCPLEITAYADFSMANYELYEQQVQNLPVLRPTKKCKYDPLFEVVEKYAVSKALTLYMNKFLLNYAAIPIFASNKRVKLPLCVTLGPDWHHGNEFDSKIGVLLPHSKTQNAFEVCVLWINEIKRHQLFASMLENAAKLLSNLEANVIKPSFEEFEVKIYDAGRENLFEISAYNRLVSASNFEELKLVAPALDWQLQSGQIVGVLLYNQAQWATVLWLDGTTNRHKIGHNGVFELTYCEYV